MPFNIIVGASSFLDENVSRSILNIIRNRSVVLVGNGNTLSTKSFRLQDKLVRALETGGARQVLYAELTSKNMVLLKKTDIIYILGGDVQEILKLYQNKLFKTLIQKHLKKGILIAEEEAAIFLSENVTWYLKEFCHFKEKTMCKGLGIVRECFFLDDQPFLDKKLQKIEKDYAITLKRLSKEDCYFTSAVI